MTSSPAVLVAVPARDEEARIEACLLSVLAAVSSARARGLIGDVMIAVAAHRCRDGTAALARSVLRAASDVATLVWETDEDVPVGAVRAGLILRARPELVEGPVPQNSWLFSTDADTVVPLGWICAGLDAAALASARMIVGLVDLVGVQPAVRLVHDQLVRAGVHLDGSHDHVYAANLAIDLATYAAVGGFAAVAAGEEHALLAAVLAAGHPVLRTSTWRVATSGRTRGRARNGLGDLLGRLERTHIDRLDRPA